MAAEDINAAMPDETGAHVPPDFICPVTQEIMQDPVIALDGHSYERGAIERWFQEGRIKSPLTNAPLGSRHLTPNHTLRKAIDNFLTHEMPHLKDQQNQLDNLETAIKLREVDLATQAAKNVVPKHEYDRVAALLRRTQEDLARAQQELDGARRVMQAVGSQLLTHAAASAPQTAAAPPPVPVPALPPPPAPTAEPTNAELAGQDGGDDGDGGGGGGSGQPQNNKELGAQLVAEFSSKRRQGAELVAEVLKLIDAGADPDVADGYGSTPLIYAAVYGHADCIGPLVGAGAKLEAKTNYGSNPLIAAAYNGLADCVAALVGAGAKLEATDISGRTPLIAAAYNGCADCVAALVGAGAKLEAKTNSGRTPLIAAAYNGRADCVAALVGAGAKLEATDSDGLTARDFAVMHKQNQWEEVVKLLDAHAGGRAPGKN